jgi:hypothetical protein
VVGSRRGARGGDVPLDIGRVLGHRRRDSEQHGEHRRGTQPFHASVLVRLKPDPTMANISPGPAEAGPYDSDDDYFRFGL